MTQSTDTTDLAERIAPLVAHLARLQEQRVELDADIETVKTVLRSMVPGPDTYGGQDGGLALVITANRKLDVEAAATAAIATGVSPEALRSDGYDGKKVRQHLTPAQVESFMVEQGEPRVSLR